MKLRNAGLFIVSVCLSFVLLELGLRLLLPIVSNQPDPRKVERHIHDAFRGHALNPEFQTKLNTLGKKIHSPDGFRSDHAISKAHPRNTFRIILLGGSALYGIGSQGDYYPIHPDLMNDETINYFLQKKLAEEFKTLKIEVINAGVVGYHTFQHLVYLNSQLLDYRPDLVINFDGHNDFYIADPGYRPWLDYQYGATNLMKAISDRDFIIGFHFLVRYFSDYSRLFTQIEKRVTQKLYEDHLQQKFAIPASAITEFSIQNYEKTAEKTFLRALWQINRLGEREGYQHLVFLQPEIVFEDNKLLSISDLHLKELTWKNLKSERVQEMKLMRENMPRLFSKYLIPFHDLGTISSQSTANESLYIDYCHLTPKGSEVVADRMLSAVSKSMRKILGNNSHSSTLGE